MAESRLFQMVYLLLEKGSMTAPELAERFEVSVRTIYRDIDTLSGAGVPVYTAQGKGGGIFLENSYVLDKSLISEQEQNQILLALQGLGLIGNEQSKDLLSKLGAIFRKQHTAWLEVDFSGWNQKSEKTFHLLQKAIFQSKTVRFTYYSGKGQHIGRTAEPLKLIFKGGEWYLYAYCPLREEHRLFKLVRIKDPEITEQSFVRATPECVLPDMKSQPDAAIPLTLLFDGELAYRVYENFEDITKRPDGTYRVRTFMPDHESTYGFLLSFGDRMEVLEPAAVRNEMMVRIDNMQKKYKT